jgi:hypothetical protein
MARYLKPNELKRILASAVGVRATRMQLLLKAIG